MGYSKYIEHVMQEEGCKNCGGRSMSRPYSHASRDTAKYKSIKFRRIFKRKKYPDDI